MEGTAVQTQDSAAALRRAFFADLLEPFQPRLVLQPVRLEVLQTQADGDCLWPLLPLDRYN
jgi:hypothetical protein